MTERNGANPASTAELYARKILQGFMQHFARFSDITVGARTHFAAGDWQAMQEATRDRIAFYDERVQTTVELLTALTSDQLHESIWSETRQIYQRYLQFHPQAELAETFYNSVFCSLFHRRYFNNDFIFVRSVLEQGLPLPIASGICSYFPVELGMRRTLKAVIERIDFAAEFVDLEQDIRLLRAAFKAQTATADLAVYELRIDVLQAPFYRNKAAYVVGRLVTTSQTFPFIVAVLRDADSGKLVLDALITDAALMAIIFSFTRSPFMVSTRVPAALVRFLKDLMPNKTLAELYSAIGLHKQSKTEFYREFLQHLANSDESLVPAAGVKGLVMTVFTLPSFPYVFKVIKDEFGASKQIDRQTVIDRYRMVKRHDRVGRMADTFEFADVAVPLSRVAADLLDELKRTVASSLRFEGEQLIIKQLFIERRMMPLNLYLEYCHANQQHDDIKDALDDYGHALKDMLKANIFPGDMLLKNFGVTRHGRVVFYDYDEVRYLTDMALRELPDGDDVSVLAGDVFPAQVPTFAIPKAQWRQWLLAKHPELGDVDYWRVQQKNARDGAIADVFPYPKQWRFSRDG